TDLEYTLTVRDTVRGTVKTYHNPVTDSLVCLGADTSGFANAPTPTPTESGGSPTPTPTRTPTPPAGMTRVVSVRDIFFRDSVSGNSTTTIGVGTTVEWQWQASLPHSTTSGNCPPCSPDGRWNSGVMSNGEFSRTFSQAGNFPYYCSVHGVMMTGTVVVNP
ncbi:MAG: cupredoxin domain-containing protein, partial [Thermoanaerobaculia bacterium]